MSRPDIEFQWIVPEGDRFEIIRLIEASGGSIQMSGEEYIPPPDDPLNAADSSFEPTIVIVTFMAGPQALLTLQRLWLNMRNRGGMIIDARGKDVRVRSLPSLDRGTIVLVTNEGSEVHRPGTAEAVAEIAAKHLTMLRRTS
jgi:hypothetical protein